METEFDDIAERIRRIGFFDVKHYLSTYPDVASANIDPLRHYVQNGALEGRVPNKWFDPEIYKLLVPTAGEVAALPPLYHYMSLTADDRLEYESVVRGATSHRLDEAIQIIRSSYFDSDHYISQLSDGTRPIVPIFHYLAVGSQAGLWPRKDFDPAFYRRMYPDVAATGIDPLFHYVKYGQSEQRKASHLEGGEGAPYTAADIRAIRESGLFDADYYRKMVTVMHLDADPLMHYLNLGHMNYISPSKAFDAIFYYATVPESRRDDMSPLVHYLRHGRAAGEAILPSGRYHWAGQGLSGEDDIHIERLHAASFFYRHNLGTEGDLDFRCRQGAIVELSSRAPCELEGAAPAVSIIIPVYGQLPFVLNCLDSLATHKSKYTFEVILFDDASPAETQIGAVAAVSWVRYIHGGQNRGFIGACNYASSFANGEYVVLLNSDTRVCDGWLDELIDTFSDQPEAGFVGSKLYNGDGSLQEAGAIVWEDGSAWNYGRNDDPSRPEYCYARQVDYCSGAAIALPTALWNELGGFDGHFAPAYYEDVDIAYRVRQAGRQVWMQPLARVIHYEGMTHGRDETKGVKASQVVNSRKFFERWRETLEGHGRNGVDPFKASNRACGRYMLAIDAEIPAPKRDAGSVMTFKLLQIFQRLGWHITFIPVHDPRFHQDHSPDMQRLGIETLAYANVEQFLRQRERIYDTVLAFRVTVLETLIDKIRALDPALLVLFHDIDLHFLRMEREAEIKNSRYLARQADIMKTAELGLVAKVDCTIVPSTVEKEIILDEVGVDNVVVYSYTADVVPNSISFSDRRHLVFVGGFRHVPNIDAMEFFIQKIWPDLKKKLPDDVKFYIIGSDAPTSLRALASGDDRIIFTGFLEDLAPTLETCRIFVAPLRYGAGLKGKVVTSLSHGVPCVASSIAIEGMALTPDKEVLEANEGDAFISQITRLYDDEKLWGRLREAGYAFVEAQYSWQAGMDVARDILDVGEKGWSDRQQQERDGKLAELLAGRRDKVALLRPEGGAVTRMMEIVR